MPTLETITAMMTPLFPRFYFDFSPEGNISPLPSLLQLPVHDAIVSCQRRLNLLTAEKDALLRAVLQQNRIAIRRVE